MLIDKNELLKKEWEGVSDYLKKEDPDSTKLAIIEAENVFLKIIKNGDYKAKSLEDKIGLAIKEIKRPEVFLKMREKALKMKNDPGANIADPFSGREIVDVYREAIGEILFGVINEKMMQSFKYRFWTPYYYFFYHRKSVYRFLIYFFIIIALMLFIADTAMGELVFGYLIDKVHVILRTILFVIFLLFIAVFFITFSVIIWESRFKKRAKR